MGGMRTLPSAIPASASADSRKKATGFSTNARAHCPPTSATKATPMATCGPSCFPIHGATAPNTAKQSVGSEVRNPLQPGVRPRSAEISARTGPTETATGRRLNARTTMATIGMNRMNPERSITPTL